MLFGKYDYKTDLRVKTKEAYDDGLTDGISQGIEQQKAEDEKQLAQKDEEIERLKQQLATVLNR